jgi:hypothetical protein
MTVGWIAAVTWILAAVVCLAGSQPANLVRDPSFERAPAGVEVPKEWFYFFRTEDAYHVAVVKGGRTGAQSLLFEGKGKGEFAGATLKPIPLETGKRYAARGWVKVEGEGKPTGTIKLDYFDAEGKYLASFAPGLVTTASRGWQLVSVANPASHAEGARSIAAAIAMTAQGKVWFDDIEVVVRDHTVLPTSLIHNGSMENIAGPQITNWGLGSSPDGKATMEASAEEPKDGWYCLRLKGNSEWAVAVTERVKWERDRPYTLTGYARAKSGEAQIKIDYFEGDKHLGSTTSDTVSARDWQKRTVTAEPDKFPGATHIAAAAVGLGQMDVSFDSFTLTSR